MMMAGQERKIRKDNGPGWTLNYKKKNTKNKRAVVGVSKN